MFWILSPIVSAGLISLIVILGGCGATVTGQMWKKDKGQLCGDPTDNGGVDISPGSSLCRYGKGWIVALRWRW